MSEKVNCYKCKHRGTVPGSCHSSCQHPDAQSGRNPMKAASFLGVVGHEMGIRKGWFSWPHNFDPVWLKECNGFESKETPNES